MCVAIIMADPVGNVIKILLKKFRINESHDNGGGVDISASPS